MTFDDIYRDYDPEPVETWREPGDFCGLSLMELIAMSTWDDLVPSGGSNVSAADLAGGPMRTRIKSLEMADFTDDGRTRRKPVLHFDNDRTLTVNRTNAEKLTELFGDNPESAIGREIELYRDPDVRDPSGQRTGGVRMRGVTAETSAPAQPERSTCQKLIDQIQAANDNGEIDRLAMIAMDQNRSGNLSDADMLALKKHADARRSVLSRPDQDNIPF